MPKFLLDLWMKLPFNVKIVRLKEELKQQKIFYEKELTKTGNERECWKETSRDFTRKNKLLQKEIDQLKEKLNAK